ncbi:DUF4245 domain-containing protein [Gordonia soli]|uniref:DUF4245 domain-containing protein n=1 Tax=Gordonia soli NBRC 108243 TaxID=1223545 RepID=M0QQH0_9ACTN|nr:DUF4245 domain-containing protein [Gordonia soli]GAC70491.1 hypothetical protein GS4_35_00670 [Gordonia soli NBRC 108243]
MAGKPRILHSNKDMIWSLIPLLAVCALVVVASGNCSVGLTGGASDDRTPAFDVTTALRADARALPFPVRLPPTPEKWKPNSGSTQPVGGSFVSNAGWVTASGAYLQLSQSGGKEEDLVSSIAGDSRVFGAGTREVGGRQWVTYTGDGKKIWITDLGDVRIGLLSRGPDSEMEQLGSSVLAQQPLPRSPS